jgi:cysteinyl-tRNA synthetase
LGLRLYNTATRRKEVFRPLNEGKVGIYACGVTVYDLCHIGHARSAIVFDTLVRYLRAKGFDVKYVRNFTDVDDKIIERARQTGKEASLLAQEYIEAFHKDMGQLGIMKADVEPKATEHIGDMVQMITTLLERRYAYKEGTDVFFSVEEFKEYGRLSGRKLEDMQAGRRIAVDEKKRHPMDFVLWKGAKPGEPQWESPWGWGRPGWHIECSVMSNKYLGVSFDIHGGGRDLLFPHHENERAQSIAANGGGFANFWVHNGFVTVDSEKMSKSLGNFLTVRNALEQYHPQVLRLFLISKHYRTPLDFSKDAVSSQQAGLVRMYRALQKLEDLIGAPREDMGETSEKLLFQDAPVHDGKGGERFLEAFTELMDDDLNTAGVIGLMFEKVKDMNKLIDSAGRSVNESICRQLEDDRQNLLRVGRVLGLLEQSPAEFFEELSVAAPKIDPVQVERMIAEREAARAKKAWAEADAIRDRLKELGVVLEDGPKGTTWRLDV